MTTADEMPVTDTTMPAGALAVDAADAADAMFCPRCGFDLRRTASGRCGECGLAFDRADLSRSPVPWARRRRVGRVRAFLKTVWLLTTDRPRVRHELAKPRASGDALCFQGWVAACVAAALLVAAVAAEHRVVLDSLVVGQRSMFDHFLPGGSWFDKGNRWIGIGQDLTVPWSAGVTLLPVPVACLIGLALYSVGMGQATPDRSRRRFPWWRIYSGPASPGGPPRPRRGAPHHPRGLA